MPRRMIAGRVSVPLEHTQTDADRRQKVAATRAEAHKDEHVQAGEL